MMAKSAIRNNLGRTILGLAVSGLTCGAASAGPDVVVADLYNLANWGNVSGIEAYSVGTDSCNLGDQDLQWHSWDRFRPVIGQNLYRIKDGRFDHIGQSWLKWGFAALNLNLCGICDDPGTSSALGPLCSDPYSASLNGSASSLGPKSIVNAYTGEFPASHATPSGNSTIRGRVQVKQADVDPAQNSGATYYVEGQYIHPDDAGAGAALNNASHRQVWITGTNDLTFNKPTGGLSSTVRFEPAILAWQHEDATVNVETVDVPNEGRFYVGWKSSDIGGGMYHHEIAIFNLNSDRSIGAVTVTLPAGSTVANQGFNDVDYHSGEPYSLTDWTQSSTSSSVSWATEDFATNANANALRFGTTYTFRFDGDMDGAHIYDLEMTLFKPGTPSAITLTLNASDCVGDIDGDNDVDLGDLSILLSNYPTASGATPADGDLDGDGDIDLSDLSILLANYLNPC